MDQSVLDKEAFSQTYLVCGLNPEQIDKVAALATIRRHSAQDILISSNNHGGELFLILKGRVKVVTDDGDQLAEIGPGSVLGEVELIDAGPKSANAVCIGMVDIAVIGVPQMRALMKSDYEMGFKILTNLARVLCGRLRRADAMLDTLLVEAHGGSWGNAL